MSTDIRRNNNTSSSDIFRDRSKNIGQWKKKSSSLKEEEVVRIGTDCLETSLYNVLQLLNDKFI